MGQMTKLLGLLFLVVSLPAVESSAEVGKCSYEGQLYPEGAEACRDGMRVRCEAGSWGDIGFCEEGELPSSPTPDDEDDGEDDERVGR